jgi:multidrug efflux pump subunit AcrA (membrane-fusion protein)
MKNLNKIKLGMIGGGTGAFIGDVHRRASRICNDYELLGGVFDVDYEKGKEFAKLEGIDLNRCYASIDEFIEGELALPQLPIMRLENLNNKYIEVSLEQDAALKVKKGQSAQIIFESLASEKLSGSVQNIYPKNGEFLARIEANDLKDSILPGMTADVVIKVGSKKNVLLIPVRSIIDGRLLRYRNEKTEKIEIKIGHTDGAWAQVVEGDIKINDQVIIKGK